MSTEIDAREAQALLEAGEAVALDVREPDEWQRGHVAGALHIPLGELGERLAEVPTDRRIIAVCHSGGRSSAVIAPLQGLGYDVVNLTGGVLAWAQAGLPLEPGP